MLQHGGAQKWDAEGKGHQVGQGGAKSDNAIYWQLLDAALITISDAEKIMVGLIDIDYCA